MGHPQALAQKDVLALRALAGKVADKGENIAAVVREAERLARGGKEKQKATVALGPVFELPTAVVVTRGGSSFDVDEARAHFAAAGAAKQKTPEVIMVVDELPRTPSGKVRKDVLRAQAASEAKG